jgi:hypothetical protein
MDLRITGLEQVQKRLREAAPTLVIKTFAKALDRASGVMAAEVELRAEGHPDSGSDTRLAEHVIIKTEIDTRARGGVSTVGYDSSLDERTGIPQDLKGYLVEYGHRMVTHKPEKKEVGHVPAYPIMRPAFDSSADNAIEVFAETVIDGLSEIEKTT